MKTSPGGQEISSFIVRISREDGAERSRFGGSRILDGWFGPKQLWKAGGLRAGLGSDMNCQGPSQESRTASRWKINYSGQSTTSKTGFTSNEAGAWQH